MSDYVKFENAGWVHCPRNGEKQVASKLKNADDSLLKEDSDGCKEQKSKLDMGEVSDGYHTFNQLYHQRAVLFATIVNQNKDKAWKSWKHEDGQFCFDKEREWFIVGVDTPEGSYTYHYEKKYWDLFDCEELDRGKHWDGHTEDDVTRLLSLPPVEPKRPKGEWIDKQEGTFCSECDYRTNVFHNFCPNCGADMRGMVTESEE